MKKTVALNILHNMYERKIEELDEYKDRKRLSNGKLGNYRNNVELIEKELVKYRIKKLISLKNRILKKDGKYLSSYELLSEKIDYLKTLLGGATDRMSLVVSDINDCDSVIEDLYDDIKTISYYIERIKERMTYEKLFHKTTDELEDLEIIEYINRNDFNNKEFISELSNKVLKK